MTIDIKSVLSVIAKEMGITYKEWAKTAGIPSGTLYKIMSGETAEPRFDTIVTLLDAVGLSLKNVDPVYQAEIHKATESDPSINKLSTEDFIELYLKLSENGKTLILSNIMKLLQYEAEAVSEETYRELQVFLLPASAGYGNMLDDYSSYDFVAFPVSIIPPRTKFAIRVTGDSMEPDFFHEDIIFIEPTEYLHHHDIGVFVLNGEGYIKEYNKEDGCLISHNPKYPPIQLKPDDSIHVVGRVLGKYTERT